ncbi:MAG: hypothetical protein ACK4NZ_06150 [Tsuneonella sp.]
MAAKRHKAEEIVTKLHHVLGRDLLGAVPPLKTATHCDPKIAKGTEYFSFSIGC